MKGSIKVGIDVGGTFTHAVAVDARELKLLGKAVVPTTHTDQAGVAAGVVASLLELIERTGLERAEIALIAHSTTQATNALLEGDVARVGIVGLGGGFAGALAKRQANVRGLELSPGKELATEFEWVERRRGAHPSDDALRAAIDRLVSRGAEVIVASELFGVDDPSVELRVCELAKEKGLPGTAASAISKLYGLRIRTRTAVLNACMLPKMLDTARHIETAMEESGIDAPLMVMRSDGGIMDVEAMRQRPILTMLSGPAAGVAAALMYQKITDGVFVEVGGTSSDICAIRHGRPIVTNARLGEHRLYLRTLDVRTVGIGGGSVPRVKGGAIHAVGPRSAHIARLGYDAFRQGDSALTPGTRRPLDGDPDDYLELVPEEASEPAVTLTPTGAANVLGLASGYGKGDPAGLDSSFGAVSRWLSKSAEEIATRILELCAQKVSPVIDDLRAEHGLDHEHCLVVGGGGGAEAVVPFTAKSLGLVHEIADEAEVISAIGVALGMIQETIERTAIDPGEAELSAVRRDAVDAVLRMGAAPESVQVVLEVDRQSKVVRATAQGTPEMRTRDLAESEDSEEARRASAARGAGLPESALREVARLGWLQIWNAESRRKRLFGLISKRTHPAVVVDGEGVVRLVLEDARVETCAAREAERVLREALENLASYGDGGVALPEVYLVGPRRVADYSGLADEAQVSAALRLDLADFEAAQPVALLCARREA